MNYTHLSLFGFGLLGVALHILVELNKLNKQPAGSFTIKGYFKLEMFAIMISIIVCACCVFASQEIKQLQQIGNWLGLAFVAIGYMGQSLLIAFMGKAQSVIDKNIG